MGYSYLLADIPQRLEAKLIDGLFLFCAIAPAALVWKKGLFSEDYICTQFEGVLLLISSALLLALFVTQVFFLARHSQSIGKRIVGIKIIRKNGRRADAFRLIFIREFLVWVIALLPGIGQLFLLVNFCFLFRDNRRCLHDLLAGTSVRQWWD